jgi:hypothetical protein
MALSKLSIPGIRFGSAGNFERDSEGLKKPVPLVRRNVLQNFVEVRYDIARPMGKPIPERVQGDKKTSIMAIVRKFGDVEDDFHFAIKCRRLVKSKVDPKCQTKIRRI